MSFSTIFTAILSPTTTGTAFFSILSLLFFQGFVSELLYMCCFSTVSNFNFFINFHFWLHGSVSSTINLTLCRLPFFFSLSFVFFQRNYRSISLICIYVYLNYFSDFFQIVLLYGLLSMMCQFCLQIAVNLGTLQVQVFGNWSYRSIFLLYQPCSFLKNCTKTNMLRSLFRGPYSFFPLKD